MARYDDITFIEQHIEKGALLLCLLLLVCAVGQWFWHSPRKIDGVRPDKIDEKLSKKAKEIKDLADGAKPKKTKLIKYGPIIARLQKGPSFNPMIDFAGGRNAWRRRPGPDAAETVDLAEVESAMPAPEKPLAWAGYQIPHKDPNKPADVRGAHVGLFYPWRLLMKSWREVFKNTHKPKLIAFGVRVQVQEGLGNGEFGPERVLATVAWQKPGPNGKVIQVPKLPPYKQNADEVREAIALLEASQVQDLILRPGYWPILHARTQQIIDWRNNLPKTLWPAAKETLAQQIEKDRILIWFHHDGLASRTNYRYKVQLLMLNPLLTHDNLVDPSKPEHAQKVFLVTPWSPWSEPVLIPKTTSFLLSAHNPMSTTPYVTATITTRALGKQVSKPFRIFFSGQPIGGPSKEADFSTGAIVVDLKYVSAKAPDGSAQTKPPEMLYLDDNGVLQRRWYTKDKAEYDAIMRLKKPRAGKSKTKKLAPVPASVYEELFEGTIKPRTPVSGR